MGSGDSSIACGREGCSIAVSSLFETSSMGVIRSSTAGFAEATGDPCSVAELSVVGIADDSAFASLD